MQDETPLFQRYLLLQLAFACLFFLLGCVLFVVGTLPMNNVFAELVRTEHPLLALSANARLFPGYLILTPAFMFLVWPLVRTRKAIRERHCIKSMLWICLANMLVHFLSLGPLGLLHPDAREVLVRALSRVLPEGAANLAAGPLTLWSFGLLLAALVLWASVLILRLPRWRAFLLVPATLVLLAATGADVVEAPTRSARTEPDILILASDSLRADRLGCYGSQRNTSPAIDALAKESVVFDNMVVSTASTLESWTSILTGQLPQRHGLRYMFITKAAADKMQAEANTLPRLLQHAGWHTVVSSNWAGNCFRAVDHGFAANHASDIQNLDVFVTEAALAAHWTVPLHFANPLGERLFPVLERVSSWLGPDVLKRRLYAELGDADSAGQRCFGVLFTSHTHLPYAPSATHLAEFVDPEYSGPNQSELAFDIDDFIQHGFPTDVSAAEQRRVQDLYDACVRDFDAFVADVVADLAESGRLEHTILVVTSDHGDDLYDPGTSLGHGTNFFGGDQTTRIPCLVRFPKGAHRGRVAALTRSVDLHPTLLTLAGVKPPPSDGVNLLPLIEGRAQETGFPAIAETCYLFHHKKLHPAGVKSARAMSSTLMVDAEFRNSFVLRPEYHDEVIAAKDLMLRTPRWKLLRLPTATGALWQLFDMHADPQQQHDLIGTGLAVEARLKQALESWRETSRVPPWSIADDDPQR
jgi:arylsulfatase A-like enzyme